MPAFGLGTWKSHKGDAHQAVKEAIRIGYRHIDGAWIYQNEEEVGQAICESIAAGVVAREDLFVTSKLWNSFHAPEDVATGCRETLTALGLEYVDLYLIHWPVAFRPGILMPDKPEGFWPLPEMPLAKTFEAMLQLKEQGLVKSVGVSNFSISKLQQLIAESGAVPTVNQVELHLYNPQNDLLAYCGDQGSHLTAYSPLGSRDRPDSMKANNEPPLLENETVQAIAATEGLTPAQLLIAWAIDRGTSVIPKSANPVRIAENLQAASHTLSSQARDQLNQIDVQFRYVNPTGWFLPGVTYQGNDFWA
ncbi:MAG: aldo/keto reductase [Leptolyngbya sp. SIO1D8]|nr:aldo/keto reductase [Leptolyngbya sp. SIO1D8]